MIVIIGGALSSLWHITTFDVILKHLEIVEERLNGLPSLMLYLLQEETDPRATSFIVESS